VLGECGSDGSPEECRGPERGEQYHGLPSEPVSLDVERTWPGGYLKEIRVDDWL
jgi:hypothetical protein